VRAGTGIALTHRGAEKKQRWEEKTKGKKVGEKDELSFFRKQLAGIEFLCGGKGG